MKKFAILASILAMITLAGCITKNPSHAPISINGGPATNPPPAYIPSPGPSNAIAQLQALNTMTAPVDPYSAPIGLVLGGIGSVIAAASTWYAKRKSDALASSQDAHAQTMSLLNTVVKGVEDANVPAVKQAIQQRSLITGNQDALNAVVQNLT